MKQMFKRMSSAALAVLLAAVLMTAGTVCVSASDEVDESLREQLILTAEGLTETIIPLSDGEIEEYLGSSDAFTAAAMESWNTSRDELGEMKEDGMADAVFETSDDGYMVTVPVAFEKSDAEFEYMFDESGYPVSMAVNIPYPLSVSMQRAALNTVMGLGTVFIVLIFLSFVISLMKYIPKLLEGGKKKEEPAKAETPTVAPAASEAADDGELIAVIAAAIAASEGTSTDGFVVRSIRKVNRKKW